MDSIRLSDFDVRLASLAGIGQWSLDKQDGLTLCPALCAMLGVSEGLLRPRSILKLLNKQDRKCLLEDLRSLAHSGQAIQSILLFQGPGEQKTWVRCHTVGTTKSGPQTQLFGLVQDITREQNFAADLRRSHLSAEKAASMAGVGAWSIDLKSNRLTWSKEVFVIHDLPPGRQPTVEEAIAYYPPESRELLEERLGELITHGTPMDIELRMTTATGRTIWVRTMGDVDRHEEGPPRHIYGVFQDITSKHEVSAKLQEREERGRLALAGNEDGVWDWMVKDNQVKFSARYKAILGYAEDELEDSLESWETSLHPDDRHRTMMLVEQALAGECDNYRVEFRMRHKQGSWRWILARGKVVQRDEDGNPVRMVGTHTDIDDQVAIREELVLAKEGAEAAARAKAKFLATMSHEIRTPMNGILGMAQVLLNSEQDPKSRTYVETILSSGTALLTILNDVLDLSKIESGHLDLEKEAFDLKAAMQDVVFLLKPSAKKKGTTLRLEYSSDLGTCFLGDSVRFRQVLMNLVGNAIKFTQSGGTILRVSPQSNGTETPKGQLPTVQDLVFEVVDTGIGIDADQCRALFEPFAQADASTTRKFGGTGLGLSISKQLVHLMGGEIGATSRPGQGSTFWFSLQLPVLPMGTLARPLDKVKPALPTRIPSAAPGEDRILVVEDNTVNQLVARKLIEQLGYRVTIVANGAMALEAMGHSSFALVLMDCQMPVMDGYEATKRRRAQEVREGLEHMRIVAMTANALAADEQRCLDCGMDGYLSKPVVASQLAEVLSQATHTTS